MDKEESNLSQLHLIYNFNKQKIIIFKAIKVIDNLMEMTKEYFQSFNRKLI
jgi:hypothetical protein